MPAAVSYRQPRPAAQAAPAQLSAVVLVMAASWPQQEGTTQWLSMPDVAAETAAERRRLAAARLVQGCEEQAQQPVGRQETALVVRYP